MAQFRLIGSDQVIFGREAFTIDILFQDQPDNDEANEPRNDKRHWGACDHSLFLSELVKQPVHGGRLSYSIRPRFQGLRGLDAIGLLGAEKSAGEDFQMTPVPNSVNSVNP